MICDICGSKNALVRKVAGTYGKGRKLLVIENVPVVTCPSCGESYLTADALHEIELASSFNASVLPTSVRSQWLHLAESLLLLLHSYINSPRWTGLVCRV